MKACVTQALLTSKRVIRWDIEEQRDIKIMIREGEDSGSGCIDKSDSFVVQFSFFFFTSCSL